jgi:HD-GYP domain-containing protein (c-di-GMP phosphodiesterase class II)
MTTEATSSAQSSLPAPQTSSPALLKAVTQLAQTQRVVTSRAIFNNQGIKLIESGMQIDESLYDRLVRHRLSAPLDESMTTDTVVDSQTLREASEAAMARWPFFALMGPPGRVRGMLLQAIEAILLPKPIAFQLTLARETRPALFEHSVLMALLCAHLVREGGAPIHDMTIAATAGLLHDLGMMNIDSELLGAENKLSGDERRPIYVHPMTSSMLIARFHEYPKQVPRAILEHHELLDGSGYPRGLAGDAISPLGRLLSLCEVVTAMFDGERELPEQRVSLLLRISPRRFDQALVPSIHRLLRALGPSAGKVGKSAEESVKRLQILATLLNKWHTAAAESAPLVQGAAQSILNDVAAQAATLQRMLFEAGITLDQLELLTQGADTDAGLRDELWVLGREIQWHLNSSANQLRRRWRSAAEGQPFAPAVAAWLDEVEALDEKA